MSPQERLEALVTAIRGGSDLDTACHFSGLSAAVIARQLEQGMVAAQLEAAGEKLGSDDLEALKVWNAITKARADAVVRNVTLIQKAAQEGSWQAAAWWLERAVPSEYGKKTPERIQAARPPQSIGD